MKFVVSSNIKEFDVYSSELSAVGQDADGCLIYDMQVMAGVVLEDTTDVIVITVTVEKREKK